MKTVAKINDLILLFLAAYTPFYTTFSSGPLQYINFLHLTPVLLAYIFLLTLIKTPNIGKMGKISTSLVLFFVAQVISTMFANDLGLALSKTFIELQFLVVCLLMNKLINSNRSYEYIFLGLLIGFLVSCVIAVLQKLGYQQFYIFSEKELNTNAGLIMETRAKSSQVLRIWGPFGNSLTFSEYLSIAGVVLYGYYRAIRKNLLISLVILGLSVYCIALTAGRNAFFATGFSLLFIEFSYAQGNFSQRILTLIIFMGLVLGALFLLLPGIQDNGNPLIDRFSHASQDLKAGRLNLWIKGYAAFTKNIFTGVGPANLHAALSSEGFPMTSEVISHFEGQHVENYYLTILFTYGIIGFVFCMRLFYYLLVYSYKLFELLKGKVKSYAFGGAMMGGILALIIGNITNPALIFDERIKMMFLFMIIVINNSFLQFNRVEFFKKDTFFRNLFTKRK